MEKNTNIWTEFFCKKFLLVVYLLCGNNSPQFVNKQNEIFKAY